MSRSFIHLRRALFGLSCAIVFGFGATQAFASPDQVYGPPRCERTGVAYLPLNPEEVCPNCPFSGYCDGVNSECVCPEW
jgi:hypothetical protein